MKDFLKEFFNLFSCLAWFLSAAERYCLRHGDYSLGRSATGLDPTKGEKDEIKYADLLNIKK